MSTCNCQILKDPFGNVITIPEELCVMIAALVDHELDATIPDIINKPALVIQTLNLERMYYLRQYTFSTSILIKTSLRNGRYTAYDFVINPPTAVMGSLINKAKILSLLELEALS